MSFDSLLRWLNGSLRPRSPRNRSARRGRFVPRLDVLEDRALPSTFTVLNLGDSGAGSLRQAVLDANASPGADVIDFAPAARDGTITLATGQLSVTDDLTLDGPGAHRLTVSGNNASRVFSVSGGPTDVEIRGLAIADGRATGPTAAGPLGPVTLGGGLLNTGARVTLSHVTLANNQAVGPLASGGAVANVAGAALMVTQGTFTGNWAAGTSATAGGAIANDSGSDLVLDHSTFTGNQVTTALGAGPGFQGLTAGGAVFNAGGSRASVSHSTFAGNLARGGNGADGGPGRNGGAGGPGTGGAISNEVVSFLIPFASSTMTVEHSLFLGNRAVGGNGGTGGVGGNGGGDASRPSQGGAILNGGSTLSVSHSTFLGNQAVGANGGQGGAGGNGGPGSPGAGGAISSTRPAPAQTGGIAFRSTLQVSNSLFLGNEALGGSGGDGGSGGSGGAGGPGQGGGLRTLATDWEVSDGVFLFNRAAGGAGGDKGSGGLLGGTGGDGQGGGLLNVNGSVGTLSDSTVVRTTAAGGAGGVGGSGGSGQGGGVFNGGPSPAGPPSLAVQRSTIVNNDATGGAAGVGGSDGQGVGGGLYSTPGGTVFVDRVTNIRNNRATSADDVFGIFTNSP